MNKVHRMIKPLAVLLILAAFLLAGSVFLPGERATAGAGVLYAAPAAQGSGDCLSWANACTLQTALGLAASGNEIWVQAGAYFPGSVQTDTFTLKSGVALYGGFAGTETTREERDWEANPTILSGDIDHNDTDPEANFIIENYAQIQSNNAYHVVTGSNTDATAILDGFIITAGQANGGAGWPNDYGGGFFGEYSSPTLTDLIFIGNYANISGGAMLYSQSNSTLTRVAFSGNYAVGDGGAIYKHYSGITLVDVSFTDNVASQGGGGGIYHYGGTSTMTHTIFDGNSALNGGGIFNNYGVHSYTDVTFSSNTATSGGGGIYNYSADVTVTGVAFLDNTAAGGGGIFNYGNNAQLFTNVLFSGNTASGDGGGLLQSIGTPTLVNVVFSRNTAGNRGGGLINDGTTVLTNATFSGNSAGSGGGIYNRDRVTLTNGILWGNNATNGAQIYNEGNPPIVTYSIIEGGYEGTGNLDADPRFVDAENDDVHLGAGSAAIDVGDDSVCPETDFDGVERPVGLACDMGAYEMNIFGVEVDKTASATLVLPGTKLTYTVTVTNSGPYLMGGAISDVLPTGVTLGTPITLDPPEAGTVGASAANLAYDLTLLAGQTITLTYAVQLDDMMSPGIELTNTATFAAADLAAPVSDSFTLHVNGIPSVTSTPVTSAIQRQPYTYSITVDDPDLLLGDGLTIQATTLPAWLTLTQTGDTTAELSGIPPLAGDFDVTILVTDSFGAGSDQVFTITVEPRWYIFLPVTLKSLP